jgi:thiopurine S-methyltransferase
MEPQFWHERWQRNEIGFHQARPHPALNRFWSRLGLPAGSRVFVPLAGKSPDLVWIADAGHAVFAVELSPLAVEQFHREQVIEAVRRIELRCGDYFALTPQSVGELAGVFDRASLVALPPAMRRDYVAQMNRLTRRGTRTLLVTLEYDQTQMPGPPHSVTGDEVQALYGGDHRIERLACDDTLADFPRFRERGVDRMAEVVWLLERT